MTTIREKRLTQLQPLGWVVESHPTTKRYIVLIHPLLPERRVFLGKAGALRWGRTVTTSAATRYAHIELATRAAQEETL